MNKTVLITGGTSGIGHELGKLFAKDNYNFVLVSRKKEELERVAKEFEDSSGGKVKIIPKDLSKKEAPQEIFDELKAESIQVDALVNNAGFGSYGLFVDTDLEKELNMLQLNVVALTHLSKLFLREMVKRGEGKILNVSSTAAFQPGPLMAVYFATKVYVLHFSEALSNETKGTGVTVTALCPGPTKTEFQKIGGMEDSKLVSGRRIMSAKRVAKIGYEAFNKGKPFVVVGLKNYLLTFGNRLIPRAMTVGFVRRMQERVK